MRILLILAAIVVAAQLLAGYALLKAGERAAHEAATETVVTE